MPREPTPGGRATRMPGEPTPRVRATRMPADDGGVGVLRLVGGYPPTLDPAMSQDSTSAEYIVNIFSGLVTLDSQLEVVPDLAERWELSDDGLTYTFYLRENAVFQDGKAITSQDVIYSIERACSVAMGSPVAASYLDDIVGVAEFASGEARSISGLSAPDKRTVVITIDAPKAYFLAKLTYPASFVVDREQVEGDYEAFLESPNGSGPFVLESISRDRIVLVRNALYYREPAKLERVEFNLAGGDPMTMYENGLLDIVDVGSSAIERILDPVNPLNAELSSSSELSIQYISFDVEMPPFDDPNIRRAFTMAIDREKLAHLVMLGTAEAAKGILPPSMPGYNDALEGLPYDPAKARKLLAASRYGRPGQMPELVLSVTGTSGHMDDITRAVLYMWEENLGVKVNVEQVAWEDFLDDMNRRTYQMYSSGWIADYPDPQNFVDLLFHSRSSQNHAGYNNPEVDRLLEAARVAESPDERYALYHQAEALIVEDAPWLPLTHGIEYTLVKPYVQGFHSASAIYPWLIDISVNQ
ncbi:MAG: peptide ABC transporter substrate-binding protein [Chloroflexi bacterium]|nr:peptide ABC transporter substrate-binding protein [Chloroflexota bacterium]